MARSTKQPHWRLIARARGRIAAGLYDAPQVLNRILSPRRLDAILIDLQSCPVGDGNRYRDVTADFLACWLREVIDEPLMQEEFASHGGRADFELPLRLEVLGDYPLWWFWATRYNVTSLVVEVKNEKSKTSCGAVQQADSYLNRGGRGTLGFLISRAGFTSNALDQLADIAVGGENLIVPFMHDDFRQMARARRAGPAAVMEYVRRKQVLLVQRAA